MSRREGVALTAAVAARDGGAAATERRNPLEVKISQARKTGKGNKHARSGRALDSNTDSSSSSSVFLAGCLPTRTRILLLLLSLLLCSLPTTNPRYLVWHGEVQGKALDR